MSNKNQAEGNRNIQILQQERAKGYPDLKASGEALLRLTSEAFPKPAEPSPGPEAAPDLVKVRAKVAAHYYGISESDLAYLQGRKPEPAPASEAQAPAVHPDSEIRKCIKNTFGTFFITGGRQYRYNESDRVALVELLKPLEAELAQLRARVAILDAQKVELPKLTNDVFDNGNGNNLAASLQEDKAERMFDRKWEASRLLGWWLEQRERQLLDAQRAVQAWREVARDLREQHRSAEGCLISRPRMAPGVKQEIADLRCDACKAYDALAGKGE